MTAYLDHVIASSQKDDGPIATPPAKIACAIAAPLGAVGLEALLACGFGLCVAQCHRQAFDNQLSFRAIGCRLPIGTFQHYAIEIGRASCRERVCQYV